MVIVAIVLVLLGIIAYWFAYTGQESGMADEFPSHAERKVATSSDLVYPDPAALAASSDLVVEGTVEGVAQGGTWTFAPDSGIPESGQVDRLLRVKVESTVYSASGAQAPSTVFVLDGIWEAGVGIERVEMPWAQPGDRGVFFLVDYVEYLDEVTFNYVSPAGRVLFANGRAFVADHHGPTWRAVGVGESAAADEVRSEIFKAASRARSGAARPVVDPPAPPCPAVEVCPHFEPAR